MAANATLLLSAIPAVTGKGAPYMPTLRKSLNVMFKTALPRVAPVSKTQRPLLVDLGSGDGRVVIEAARHGYKAVGYEFNPMLVLVSRGWALFDRMRGNCIGSTAFHCRDLWTLDLSDADVIIVYGLSPIMDRLGAKLLLETKPNVVVISNVFELDDKWKSVFRGDEVYVYNRR